MLTSPQLCQTIGATYRQIDYWARLGWLIEEPRGTGGSGVPRRFRETEISVAVLILTLGRLDMLGASTGKGAGRNTDYLPALIEHVRTYGLMADWDIGDVVTLHLDGFAGHAGIDTAVLA